MEIDDLKITQKIRNDVFLPALQQAAGLAAKLNGSPNDVLNGAMMAFGDMLLTLTGKQGAVLLLNGLADHLDKNSPD
jgi:hypothetical protein